MNTLFQYQVTALMAAIDDNFIRLDLRIMKSKEMLKELYCNQIKVWLPVGNGDKSISPDSPISFSNSARWSHAPGSIVSEKDIIADGNPEQSMKTYFFDESSGGKHPVTQEFTIGFRIEKARISALEKLNIHLEETSGSVGELVSRKIMLPVSLEMVQPAIRYLIATQGNFIPRTVFNPNQAIQLRWEGNLIERYELYDGVSNDPLYKGRDTTYEIPALKLKKDTTLILKGIGKLGNETYYYLSIAFNNLDIVLQRSHTENPATWEQSILFTDELNRTGAKITGKREKWEGAPMQLSFLTGGVNNVNEQMAIGSNGNVVIGPVNTALPPLPHPKLLVTNGYQAHNEVSTILALDTGNTAQGFLWGNSPEGPYDTMHLSFNYYRNAKQDIIPNKGYGTTQISSNNNGYITFNTGSVGQVPTEKVRINAEGNIGIGASSILPDFRLQVRGGAGWWKGGVAAGDTKAAVVLGELNGVANIGAHASDLKNWADLAINSGGGNVGIGTPTVHGNFRLQVQGGAGAWKGGVAAGGTETYVVLGELANVACIGGHTPDLKRWTNFAINPSGGNVGIGTLAPKTTLHVNGDSFFEGRVWVQMYDISGNPKNEIRQLSHWADSAGNNARFTHGLLFSDKKLKNNIQSIDNPLQQLISLRGVFYQWNEEGLNQQTKTVKENYRSASGTAEDNEMVWETEKQRIRKECDKTYRGFIAQEVEEVFPEWVKEDETGYKTLDTSEMLPLFVEALKEQQKQIEMLKKELVALKARIN